MITWLILLTTLSAQLDSLSLYEQELKRLEKELTETRTSLKKLRQEEKNLLHIVKQLEKEEQILNSTLKLLKKREGEVKRKLGELKEGIISSSSLIQLTLYHLEEVLSELNKTKKPSLWESFLTPESFSTYYRTQVVLKGIGEYNKTLYVKSMQTREILTSYQREKQQEFNELLKLQGEIKKKNQELELTQKEKQKLLAHVQKESKSKELTEEKLSLQIKKLEELIQELVKKAEEERKLTGVKPQTLAGQHLIWPVKGQVVGYFGTTINPKYKTKTKNNGIDIKTIPQAKVMAVANGKVIYAGYFLGYENLVIIDHNGFFSLYANLDKILVKEGQLVFQGNSIGNVGEDTLLHFELRIGGKAVNPLKYL